MTNKKDYVVLLHGFWRTAKSMKKLEKSLSENGYIVVNLDFPSRKERIENLASTHLKKCVREKCLDKNKKIHFVTHSMGAILVRYFLAKNKLKNIGKVIMLAPPNQGAKLADYLSKSSVMNSILGPALKQLNTTKEGLHKTLPSPKYKVGIIAGKYDKKVSIESTKLKNMQDFLLVPSMHTYIMNSDKVIEAVQKFIEKGKF